MTTRRKTRRTNPQCRVTPFDVLNGAIFPANVRGAGDTQGATMPNAPATGPNYSVKDAETVAAGKDVRVRLFTLAPGEVIPWHFHSAIADEFFVLDGELTVETRTPDDCRVLGVGERYRVDAQHPH